ncbi:ABC transporter family substrate-binding protein [Pseudolysinimonas yzui]|uniref:Peptide ABC transporter substrate-binding protein n=1 Tax=Pseudolysinimonas yzui TaxID=2708254 RepID=A0A8J3GR91_9MICO|nr:ABC transporter family substrate-binding protein [Pseudolysinimonas yzui]GHF18130.1 peptide ABC transporter substrate-binding protein [Pseudolysinimonas yzui]
MRIRRFGAAGAAIAAGALVLAGCAPGGGSEIEEGTALSVAWNQAFYAYNGNTADGNATANNNIIYMMSDSFAYYDDTPALVQNPDFGSYEKLSDDPLTIKYTLADGVKWSDGTAVSTADLLLSWAANSGAFNNVEPEVDPETGEVLNQDEIDAGVFFDSAAIGGGLDLVTEVPEVDGNSITMTYSEPFVDWELAFNLQLIPAHVTYQQSVDDAASDADAAAAVATAIEEGDTEVLGPLSAFWSHGYDMVSMPSDPDLVLSYGPYVITDLVQDEFVTLTANEGYTWGEHKPVIEEITVRFIGDPLAAVQALENGEVSIIAPQSTADILTALEGLDDVTVDTTSDATYEHVDLTVNNGGPFDPATYGGDAEKAQLVRQAFLKTIPRAEIIEKLIKPLNPEAVLDDSQTIFPGAPGYDDMIAENGSAEYAEVDIEGAKALLAEAGVTTPVEVNFMYALSNPRRVNEYQLIAESAAQAGFTVIDAGNDDWGSKLGDGSYDAVVFGWQSTSTAVTSSQATFYSTGGNNLNGYANEEVDALYDQLAVEYDPEAQIDLLIEIEKILWADAYGVTVFQFPGVTAYDNTVVDGVVPAPLAPMFFWNFWEWELVG